MVRKILAGLVLVLIVYLGWVWYKGRSEKTTLDSGDFTCQGCLEGEAKARFAKENAGESPDGSSERKSTSASQAAVQATAGTAPSAPAAVPPVPPSSTGTSTMVAPQNDSSTPSSHSGTGSALPPTNVSQSYSGSMGTPPAADTVPPNPQNDTHFRGAGSFEWYRQGNITWRVDTTTGHSCIVYATMEEWRKEVVISHGCGRNA